MKSFFEDHQVKKYSFNDKIKWIFKQLIAILNPVITGETINSFTVIGKHSKEINKREKIKLVFIHPDNIKIAHEFITPFKDIQILANEKEIQIFGTSFCYKFPPEHILMIWDRTKKMKGFF